MHWLKFVCFLVFFPAQILAQNIHQFYDKDDYGFEIQAQNLFLQADKNLCELNEFTNVNIRMLIAGKDDGVPYLFQYRYRDPFDAPWKIGEFKIVSGGAKIIMTDGETAQVQMPAQMPTEKAVIVQVTLHPVLKQFQEIQLFTTIYLEDNDNVFFFNCPYLGIRNEKYVIENNGGVNMSLYNRPRNTDYSNLNEALDAQQKEALQKLRTQSAQQTMINKGFDLKTMTSNTKAFYLKEQNTTSILINDNHIEMIDGKPTNSQRMYMIAISFPGNTPGSFKIKSDAKISAAITLPQSGIGCACQFDPESESKAPTCMGGNIYINAYNNLFIEGEIVAYLESADPNTGQIFYSTLQGKFKVPIANP